MITRVTSQTMTQVALRNLQGGLGDLARLQAQATSQRAFATPSEDPSAASAVLDLHAAQRRTEQFARNIDDGLAWVTTVDSALSASTALLQRVRDLTAQGANDGALGATAKEAIAVELEGLRTELLAQANTSLLGRSVFAGTSELPAFAAGDYGFSGTAGAEVRRRVSESETVRVDADGAAAFGVGAGSVFALVDAIVGDLRAGVNVGSRLGEIDDRLDAMLGVQGAVGARQSQITRAKEATLDSTVSLEARRAQAEDVDTVEVFVKLQAQELAYQSALAVTARVLPPRLMDFLA